MLKIIRLKKLLAAISILLMAISGQAWSQTQRSGNDSTRLVQQLQQVTAEKSKLQLDNEALKKQLDELKAKSTQTGAEQAKLQQRARELELASARQQGKAGAGNEEALEKSRTQLQDLVGKYRELAQTLKNVETERDGLRTTQGAKDRDLAACVDKNAQMYLLGNEILDRMNNQGVWSAMKDKEPFTRLSRTRLENLVDDYRYRVNELKLGTKRVSAASP
jgi:chromosome segregation ATPase